MAKEPIFSSTTYLIDKKEDINITPPRFLTFYAKYSAGPVPKDLPRVKIFSCLYLPEKLLSIC